MTEEENNKKEIGVEGLGISESFEDVTETQEAEVASDVGGIKEAGERDINRIEKGDGLSEEVGEMKEVAE